MNSAAGSRSTGLPGVARTPARIGTELAERGRRRAEEHLVDHPRASSDQRVQRMRQGEDQMEVRHRQQILAPFRQPVLLGARLALRAVAVAARAIHVARRPAAVTSLDVAAKNGGPIGGSFVVCHVTPHPEDEVVEKRIARRWKW